MLITRYKTQARSISMCAEIEHEREKEIELQLAHVQPAAAAAILQTPACDRRRARRYRYFDRNRYI